MNIKSSEVAKTNFLLTKLLYKDYVKRAGLPLSLADYNKKLEAEFETICNQKEELKQTSKSKTAKKKGR